MEKSSDDETMSLIMNTSLVSVIPINILKTLPSEKMCSMKAETTELNEAQVPTFLFFNFNSFLQNIVSVHSFTLILQNIWSYLKG